MKKIGCLAVLGIVIIIFAVCLYAYISLQQSQPPGIDKAEWAIQVYTDQDGVKIPTRYFYAESVKVSGGNVIMTTYWTFDGKKYNETKGEKVINPPFEIIRRGK